MRRAIDTAPKDGKRVILEDVSGSFELARWSAERRAWVKENGELSKITPMYWLRMLRDDLPQEGDDLPQEGDELIPQKEPESNHLVDDGYARFASAVRLSLRGGDVQGDETRAFEGHLRPGRDLAGRLFPSGQAAPQLPVAADAGFALRQVAKAVTVARLDARAEGRSERKSFARRWFAVSSIAAAMAAASLTGLYFHAELAAYVTRYVGEQDNAKTGTAGLEAAKQETQVPSQHSQKADSLARDPALHEQADRANSQAPRDTAEVKQDAGAMQPEAQQQPLEKEQRRAEALANELVRAQQVIATQVELAGKARDQAAQQKQAAEKAMASLQQSLKTEHDRAEALTGELAKARRDLETQLALLSNADDETMQAKKAAESATAELRLSLQKERDRAEALTSELATARTTIYAYEAQARKTSDQAAVLKQAAESAELELRKPLQQERERAARLEQDLAAARRDVEVALSSKTNAESATAELRRSLLERDRAQAEVREPTQSKIEEQIAIKRASSSQIPKVTQPAAVATAEPSAAEAQGNMEAARLLARASALLSQGNIGSARIVLERAVETGSARASFMLAETYDPLVLFKWRTYGTHGDVMKARELYAKALAGGIQEAKDRSVALR
jgi:hypothetical protein